MKACLRETRFRLLSREIIEDSVYPDHPLVDLIVAVMIAEKSACNQASTLCTQWQRADNASASRLGRRVVPAGHFFLKELPTVRAEVVLRRDFVPAFRTQEKIIVRTGHEFLAWYVQSRLNCRRSGRIL
jgi:hypothetical protein